jgi:hypothetical protein
METRSDVINLDNSSREAYLHMRDLTKAVNDEEFRKFREFHFK